MSGVYSTQTGMGLTYHYFLYNYIWKLMIICLDLKVNTLQTCVYLRWKVWLNIIQNRIVLFSHVSSMPLRLLIEWVTGHYLVKWLRRRYRWLLLELLHFGININPCVLNGVKLTLIILTFQMVYARVGYCYQSYLLYIYWWFVKWTSIV